MKWSIVGLTILGVIAAFCAAILMTTLRSNASTSAGGDEPTTVEVLIATQDIRAMSVVTDTMIESKTVPLAQAPLHSISETTLVVGRPLAVPLLAGQPFTSASFAREGKGLDLASKLQPGMRAVSIALSHYSGLEGLLYPGCVVDVVASFKVKTQGSIGGQALSMTLLQSVQVLAIEGETVGTVRSEEEEALAESTKGQNRYNRDLLVTLMVDSKQAKALQLAMEHGKISLAMRNPFDSEDVDKDATLLNDGRLALTADLLKSSNIAGDVDTDNEGALQGLMESLGISPSSAPNAAAAFGRTAAAVSSGSTGPAPTETRAWEVAVIRGTSVETQSFLLEDER